jgi:hypothetical protein
VARDSIFQEITAEIQSRVRGWERERAELLRAPARIAELEEMIAGANEELESIFQRKPSLRPAPVTPTRGTPT